MVEPLELMKLDNYLSSTMLPNWGEKKMFMESTLGGGYRERKKENKSEFNIFHVSMTLILH